MSDHSPLHAQYQNGDERHTTNESGASTEDDFIRLETHLTRQKRKRTSPRDHAILESAYQKNSKPDKDERLNLVKLVDLGEKEVQIWFQNRRQNDRRKSKPLQPHELIPHFRNGIPVEAKQLPSPQNSQETTESLESKEVDQSQAQREEQPSPRRTADLKSILNEEPSAPNTSSPAGILQQTPATSHGASTPPSSLVNSVERLNAAISYASSMAGIGQSDAQITKKRSHEQMAGPPEPNTQQKEDSPKDSKSLRRTSSFVRLTVSADGSVKVRVNDETTPSPPKQRPQPPPNMVSRKSSGLQRAQSDVASVFKFKDVAPKGAVGRSRDARTWEFYCDRSNRSSLAARAEEEATGSAVGALGLMRSASQRRVQALSPNPNKQNHLRRSQSKLKTKQSLSRTQSSMARLQSSDGAFDEENVKQMKPDHPRRTSGSDSDKENWLPGTRTSTQGPRRTGPSAARSTLLQRDTDTSSDNSHSSPVLPKMSNKEVHSGGRGGKEKGDDLDVVQGLLSLSQGAWQ